MRCKICDRQTHLIVASEKGIVPNIYYSRPGETKHFPFGIYWCARCCAIETVCNEIKDAEFFRGYVYRSPDTQFYDEICAHFGSFFSGIDRDVSICEVGGNNGLFLERLRERYCFEENWAITMIDPVYPDSLAYDNTLHIGEMLSSSTIENYNLRERFDLVIARHCLAHNEDLLTFWSDVASLVAPEGILYVEVANLAETIRNSDF